MSEMIAQLENCLAQAKTLPEEIDALSELAWELRHIDSARCGVLSQKALDRSTSGVFASAPYLPGKAVSLATLAFLSYEQGKLDLALEQGYEAAAIHETLPLSRSTIDNLRILGWVYYFMGEMPNALDLHMKALSLAQHLGHKVAEASVLDGLAVIYADTGDMTHALQSHQQALQLVRAVGQPALEASILNNYAANLLAMGDYENALLNSQKSLAMARQLSLFEPLLSILDTLGQILHKLGQYEQAEQTLQEAITLTSQPENIMDQIYCTASLGMLYLEQNQLDLAEAHLGKALKMAEAMGVPPKVAECHRALSTIYEQQGDYKKALEHHQRFFKRYEEINDAESRKRLAALKVAHQVQAAKRETEIAQQHSLKLQREIEERIRIEAALEKLATIDPLTGVYNRRHFFELAHSELARSVRYGHSMAVIMLDIDHFKVVNDQHGHAAGDQVLVAITKLIQQHLRGVDFIGRYGGEEFCIVMPETGLEQGGQAAERIRASIAQHPFNTTLGQVSVTISVGVASQTAEEMRNPVFNDALDSLINDADQALLIAKRSGRNRVEFYST